MGSFNTSCTLSDLQINYGDHIVAFYLEQKNHSRSYGVYPWDNYQFASTGLTGQYDDYGRISLDKSKMNSFGLKLIGSNYEQFEDFQEVLWDQKEHAMMFIHRGIYDAALSFKPELHQEIPFIIEALNEHRKTEEALLNPPFALRLFWDFCMKKDDKKILPSFFLIDSFTGSASRTLMKQVYNHFSQIYDTQKFSQDKSVEQLEHFDLYMKMAIENHLLTNCFFTANKRIMPQMTVSQDNKWIEEALWQQKVMEFSGTRVAKLGKNSFYEKEVEKFKEGHTSLLEKHMLEFGLNKDVNSNKKLKM